MAFEKRIWTGREVEHPGRIKLTPTGIPNGYDQARSEGKIIAPGDLLSPENLNDLETRIDNEFLNKLDASQISSGVWTPTLFGLTTPGTPTYSSLRSGSYIKIGKLVIVNGGIGITSKGGISGIVAVGGLPFSVQAVGSSSYSAYNGLVEGVPTATYLSGYFYAPASAIVLVKNIAGSSGNLNANDLADTFAAYSLSGFYLTN